MQYSTCHAKVTVSNDVCRRGRLFLGALLFTFAIGMPCLARAQVPGNAGAKTVGTQSWAVLIGVEKYHRATRLRYTISDVEQIARTLQARGGCPAENILKIVETESNPRFQPLRNSLAAELPRFLAKPAAGDTVLIYFSGHGFRGPRDGKLYLAPIDCDPAAPEETGISVEWLRGQLAGCKAEFKLLVLDACHAGSEKGDDDSRSVAAKDLGAPFEGVEGVVTLASSTSEEKSQIWEEKQQSLFSYWLNQGLKGHADRDGNGEVDIDELYKYVNRNVIKTAELFFPNPQNPVRIIRSDTKGVPVVMHLTPQSLKQVLDDMAERLAWNMQEGGTPRIGVLEFTNVNAGGESLGTDFGMLGRYCAEELEHRLADYGDGKFAVVSHRLLEKALQTKDFRVEAIGAPNALRELSENVPGGGLPAVAFGKLRNRMGRTVNLQCELLASDSYDQLGYAAGTAVLNESEWAMLGRSAQVKPEDRTLVGTTSDDEAAAQARADQVVRRLDERSQGQHPLSDPNFPYRVKIMVDGKERRGEFRDNDYIVPLQQGEVYQIWVENRGGNLVLMRLLVDGLNTLPEKETLDGKETLVIAKRVNLDEARPWVLDPKFGTRFAIRGFFEDTGASAPRREFKVVDAQDSVAARQRFTSQLGMITAAFYKPDATNRSVGTGVGKLGNENVKIDSHGYVPGNLEAVVHLRYAEPDALK